MNILFLGINHKNTPLQVREKLSFTSKEQINAMVFLQKALNVKECIMLCTCNRTEIYIYSDFDSSDVDASIIIKLICDMKGLDESRYSSYFTEFKCAAAVRHLFNVTCGLDSLVLGEDQILGQVKEALERALEAGSSAKVLNTLFRDAITVAKRAKTCTKISNNSISIASLAVKLVCEEFEDGLESRSALIIGAGKMGSIALENLQAKGIGKIIVTKRLHSSKVEALTEKYDNIEVIDYGNRNKYFNECDIVISATSSPHFTVTREELQKELLYNKKRVFVDLALPRDIEESVNEIEGVRSYNIDDLKVISDENMKIRVMEAEKVKCMISEFVKAYENWFIFNGSLPVIKEIRVVADEVLNNRITQIESKLQGVSEEDMEIVKAAMKNTVNELLEKLVYSIKDCGTKEDIESYFKCMEVVMNHGNKEENVEYIKKLEKRA